MTAGPSPPAIALSGVNKRFDGLDALKDVDLEIGKGDLVALSGPSGSGKTVLLKTVVGLIEPDSGSVRIDGHETAGVPHGAREGQSAASACCSSVRPCSTACRSGRTSSSGR